MAMSASSGGSSGEPMMDINTTPLIDVMLVLLIMFIITLPAPTHAVKLDLPPDCKRLPQGCPPPPLIKPDFNTVFVAPSDAILWNGTQVSLAELTDLLKGSQDLIPVPELRIQPDPNARQEIVARVIRATKYAKITKMGFIGNEYYYNEI